MTTPTNPQVLAGSWAGRTSSTIWWASPRSIRWVSLRSDMRPEVEVVAELAAQQVLGVQAVLDHRRGGPLGGDDGVVVQVPPAVVAEVLVAAVVLPGADDVEAVVVEQGDPAGAVVAVGPAQVEHEDAAGPAVDGVGPRVAGLGGQLLGGDLPDDRGVAGVGLGVQHIGPRGADAGDDQVAALQRRRGRRGPGGTGRWSRRSSRSGAARCRPSAARSSRPPGRSRARTGRSRAPRWRPWPGRPGRRRPRRPAARAGPRSPRRAPVEGGIGGLGHGHLPPAGASGDSKPAQSLRRHVRRPSTPARSAPVG